MYKIYRDGRRYGNKVFDSYESARNFLRKLLRKQTEDKSKTIAISEFDFSVKRAA